MRADGRDSNGRSMSIRGGIADIIEAIPDGRMLLAYSGGLHHVQIPGQTLPRVFRTVRLNLEVLEIAEYRQEIMSNVGDRTFKRAVVEDLEQRKATYCPPPQQ